MCNSEQLEVGGLTIRSSLQPGHADGGPEGDSSSASGSMEGALVHRRAGHRPGGVPWWAVRIKTKSQFNEQLRRLAITRLPFQAVPFYLLAALRRGCARTVWTDKKRFLPLLLPQSNFR